MTPDEFMNRTTKTRGRAALRQASYFWMLGGTYADATGTALSGSRRSPAALRPAHIGPMHRVGWGIIPAGSHQRGIEAPFW